MQEIYEKIVELIHGKKEFVLAAVVSAENSTAGKTGFKMVILPDGKFFGTVGGGIVEKDVMDTAMNLFRTRKPFLKTYTLQEGDETSLGMVCGGTLSVYMEYVGPKQQFVIFGAGHIGKKLYDITILDNSFDVIVSDKRADFVNEEIFPKASIFVNSNFYETVRNMPLNDGAVVVIVTSGGEDDPYILKALYEKNIEYQYIGMIGSLNRKSKCFEKAKELGINSDFLDSIYAPTGIAIEGDTPFEIAIAILAEIIAVRRGAVDKVKTEKKKHDEGTELFKS